MVDYALTELVAPVPGDSAAGADVRLAGPGSELFLTVKDDRAAARSAEREALAAGDPEVDPLTAGMRMWEQVAQGGGELLATQTKDLRIAAWVVEAWLRTDGLAGLADGFTLLAELIDHYWDEGLHPTDEEDENEARLAPLFGLFGREEQGTLIQPIKLLPLSDHATEHVALWTIEAVRAQTVRHDNPDIREELVARRNQRIAQLDAAVAGASTAFVATNLDAIDRAVAELDRLMAAVDVRTQQGRFGSQVTTPLVAIADVLRQHHAVPAASTIAPPMAVAPAETADAAATAAPEPPAKQNVLDRAGALATLIEIAGFFDRTEPQSLIGNGLRDLVRRANLSPDDLIAELLPDREARAMFMLRAGIRVEQGGNGGGGFTTF